MAMITHHGALIRFVLLYCGLFSAFGLVSPFLPAFLAARGLRPEELGMVLGTGTAVRLVCAPFAGRLADRFHIFRAELAVFAILAAGAALLYFPVHALWMVVVVSLFQAAALAPLVPLADALSLAHARSEQDGKPGGFEYGWVRGAGSAAFVVGTLLAGQVAGTHGLSAVIWLSAVCLLATSIAAILVPEFPAGPATGVDARSARVPWLALFRQRAFVRVVVIAALVLGSHAMFDSFAVIRWTDAGISPATTAVLWSESVAAEVLVFLFIGPRLLGVLNPAGALALASVCGSVRWGVMAQTTDVAALALVQPLHGFTFALLHLACMRIIAATVPRDLFGTAQAVYGLVGVGGTTAVLTVLSGWLFAHFGPSGFWAMALLSILALPVIGSLHRALQSDQEAKPLTLAAADPRAIAGNPPSRDP
jgi:MFS transporter, PPP family, 3-phenylpropionic acid transporter